MKKVKITVLRKTFIKDLAEEYGAEGPGPCPMLRLEATDETSEIDYEPVKE
ncbi:MAG TPA: hypothetical protein H9727_02490 [Candidatus Borkfalkia avistercoris]|uniref:Uncharacterized protein n=1 Tax=Candidatus Borkfalkia avistercoris TaxID=2838504 RepID=A0A9D2CYF7_9FIRM|nr:hypothetical protein [Candidatus Borkfalkia avistercoris]